jgi:hypothetical protein
METISYIRYFRGHLLSEHDQLAPSGQEYPFLEWKVITKSFAITDDKKIRFSFSENITPRLGEKVSLNLGTFEVYGPKGIDVDPPPEWKKVEPEIIKAQPERERVFSLLERVEKAIMGYGPKDFFEATLSDTFILPMYSRCRSLFQGVVALLKREFPEEALILGRSLFIESLRLTELAEAQGTRMAKILGWASESIKFDMRMLKEAAKIGFEKNIDNVMQKLKDRRRKLRQHAKQQGIRKLRKFHSVKKATAHYSNPESYFTYLLSAQMVDGTITAHIHRAHMVEEGKIRVDPTTQDTKFIGGVGAFAAEGVLLACRAAAIIFGWPELDDLEDLLRETKELHETSNDGE